MRLFIALRFPDIALRAMEDVQTALKTQSHSGNFSHRENLHLTLSFLGKNCPRAGSGFAVPTCLHRCEHLSVYTDF